MAYYGYGSDPAEYAMYQQQQQQAGMQRIFQMLMQMKMLKEQRGAQDWEKQMQQKRFGLAEQELEISRQGAQRQQAIYEQGVQERADKERRTQLIRQQYPELAPLIDTGFDPESIRLGKEKTKIDIEKARKEALGNTSDDKYRNALTLYYTAQANAIQRGEQPPPLSPQTVQMLGSMAIEPLKRVFLDLDEAIKNKDESAFIQRYEQAKKAGYPVDKPIEYAYVSAIDPFMGQNLSTLKKSLEKTSQYSALYNSYIKKRQPKGKDSKAPSSSFLNQLLNLAPPVVAGKAIKQQIGAPRKETPTKAPSTLPEGAKFLYKDKKTGKPIYVLPDGTMVWWVQE